jgi:hypothetical protein
VRKACAIFGDLLRCPNEPHVATKGVFVVFAKVGDGFVVEFEPIEQPHHFEVTPLVFRGAGLDSPV